MPTSSVSLRYSFRALGSARSHSHRPRAGSPATNKFRTVNEYIPHLVWLLTQGPNERIRCHCKYCAKKTQTEVNADIGLEVHSGKRGSSVGGGSSAGGSKPAKKVKKDHFADVDDDPTGFLADKTRRGKQQQLKKVKRSASPSYKGAYVNKERDIDLSDGALFRVGELVWVELPEPLVDPQDSTMRITHWMGVVADRTIKSNSRSTAPLQPGAPPQLANKQQFTYRCQLLGLQDELTRTEPHVQAWLAVPSPSALLTPPAMSAQASVKHAWAGLDVRRPKLGEFESVGEAITTFALASQIAAHIAGAFSMV